MKKYRLLLALAVLLGGTGWLPVQGYARLTLSSPADKRVIAAFILHEGEEVTYTWTNSIFHIPISEVFVLERGALVLETIRSGNRSAGRPVLSYNEAADLYHPGDTFLADEVNRPFEQIIFRVGEIGNPQLQVAGKIVDFKKEVGFGGQVILKIEPVHLYDLLVCLKAKSC